MLENKSFRKKILSIKNSAFHDNSDYFCPWSVIEKYYLDISCYYMFSFIIH